MQIVIQTLKITQPVKLPLACTVGDSPVQPHDVTYQRMSSLEFCTVQR